MGCWGLTDEQCVQCKDYSDSTDSNGLYTKEWIKHDNGDVYPGYNITKCVKKCDVEKG